MTVAAESPNADAWGLPGVIDFFRHQRRAVADVYPSEWHFLKDLLHERVSVLDVGCAQGGFAGIIAEHISEFRYVGLDINADMLAHARARFPRHRFEQIPEGQFAVTGGPFDLVLALGILHLHEAWRETLVSAWAHTKSALLFDLRETDQPTIEDKSRSFLRMDFGGGDRRHEAAKVPYFVINEREAEETIAKICEGALSINCFGYTHAVSDSASTPLAEVITRVWCAKRARSNPLP